MELDYSGMYETYVFNSTAKHLADLRTQIERLQAEYEDAVEEVKDGFPTCDCSHIFDLEREHYEIMKQEAS